jgi:predicted solute-binding protein
VQRHIELYVNRYTVELDERAVQVMLDWQAQTAGRPPDQTLPIFA